jgi:hypothetical protein
MITLAALVQGYVPQDTAPAEWLSAMQVDALNAPIRAYALECLGLDTVWNAKRQSYDWKDMNEKNLDGTPRTVACDEALQRCWTGHAQLVLSDLGQHGESPNEALERLPRQWREWTRALADKFTAKWKDAAAWPPALALSWTMFPDDWRRIAAYLKNGHDIPTSGPFLRGLLVHPDAEVANSAANDLMQALRARADSRTRVFVQGRLNGQGPMVEISPIDLASREWAAEPGQASGAVLEHLGAEFYSDVHVDAASPIAAFPAHGMIPKDTKKSAWLIEQVGGSARKVTASEAKQLAQKWLSGHRLEADEAAVRSEAKRMSALARRLAQA